MLQNKQFAFEVDFSDEFSEAYNLLENSNTNLFLTGKAGTGKSTFLQYFRRHTGKKVAVVAPTGVAALNVRGQTIHSFFKIKPGLITPQTVKHVSASKRKLYEKLQVLIIDEISMVRADLFDAIEYFLRINGPKKGEPFGGVQLCVIGDMFQLPPVVGYNEKQIYYENYNTPFIFGSSSFELANFKYIEFEKIYRQSDAIFIKALNKIRQGEGSEALVNYINRRYISNCDIDINLVEPTITLTSTNQIADKINQRKLAELATKEFTYQGVATGDFGLTGERLPAPEQLTLKVGAQVMFLRNDKEKRWVNGSLGIVEDLAISHVTVRVIEGMSAKLFDVTKEEWEAIEYNFDEKTGKLKENVKGAYSQYPLMPAWAITIHKSQGKTLDSVIIDLGHGAFASGQLYVALSRCRSFERIYLNKKITLRDITADNAVLQFSKVF